MRPDGFRRVFPRLYRATAASQAGRIRRPGLRAASTPPASPRSPAASLARRLGALVNTACGLTATGVALLWRTAPPDADPTAPA